MRTATALISALLLTLAALAVVVSSQSASGPFLMLSRSGRTPLPTSVVDGREMIALADVATIFKVAVQEDRAANTVRVSAGGRALLLTPGQTLVSAEGRLVSLPAPVTRSGPRLLVPIEFLDRALRFVYDEPIELRRASRLLIVGDLRVPRVTMQYEPLPNGLRLVLDVQPEVQYALVEEPGRLLVAIEADAIDEAIPAPPTQSLLNGINVLERNTLELELGPAFEAFRSATAPAAPSSGRVLVDLLSSTTAAAVPPPPLPAPRRPAAAPAPFSPRPAPGGDPLAPRSALRPLLATIVIDPGHGGDDLGTRGASGVAEKDVALAVAGRLRNAIEARFGIRVLLTRDDDRWLGPDERAAYANNNKADLFISLHANASPNPGVAGAEVFSVELDEYGNEARLQAQGEGGLLPVFGGGARQIDLVAWDRAQAPFVERSAVLADTIIGQLARSVTLSPFELQQAPMRVLVGVNMPAVLIEMGYLSNPLQEAELSSPVYQDLIVQALTEAIAEFRDHLRATAMDPGADR